MIIAASSTRFRDVPPRYCFFNRILSSGFPGETEGEFSATLALVTQIGYAGAYSFKYSPRPGTPAADMQEDGCQRLKWTSDWCGFRN